MPLNLPVVALLLIAFMTVVGFAPGLVWRYCATTPVTNGAAADVPPDVRVAVLLVYLGEPTSGETGFPAESTKGQAEVMSTPGANRSTTEP